MCETRDFYIGSYETNERETKRMESNVRMTESEFRKAMTQKDGYKSENWIHTQDEYTRRKFGN